MFVSACGKGSGDALVSDVERFRDEMCACADAACTDKVMKEYRTWRDRKREDMKNLSADEKEKFKEAVGPRLERIEREMKACSKSGAATSDSGSASCQNPQNRYCTEWSGSRWVQQGGTDAAREAASRNTCETYAKGTYRRGETCRRAGLVGACVHQENVVFWYSEGASAERTCNEIVGGAPSGRWHSASDARNL